MAAEGDVFMNTACGCNFRLIEHLGSDNWETMVVRTGNCEIRVGDKQTIPLRSSNYVRVEPPSPAPGQLWRLTCGCVVRLDTRWMGDWTTNTVLWCDQHSDEDTEWYVNDSQLATATLWDDGAGLPTPRPEADGDTTVYATAGEVKVFTSPEPAPPRLEKALDPAGCYQCPRTASWYTRSRVPLCNLCARELLAEAP